MSGWGILVSLNGEFLVSRVTALIARFRALHQRRWRIRALWITVITISVATFLATGLFGLLSDWARTDVIASMAAILTTGAVLLAVIAAVVAIAAYTAAVQRPVLVLEFNFLNNTGPGIIEWTRQPDNIYVQGNPQSFVLEQNQQLIARLTIHNRSTVSARNPALRIEFLGFARTGPPPGPGWLPVNHTRADAAYAAQWDGGADLSIHGSWSRPIPEIQLAGLYGIRNSPAYALAFFLVADGFVREWTVPVTLVTAGQN